MHKRAPQSLKLSFEEKVDPDKQKPLEMSEMKAQPLDEHPNSKASPFQSLEEWKLLVMPDTLYSTIILYFIIFYYFIRILKFVQFLEDRPITNLCESLPYLTLPYLSKFPFWFIYLIRYMRYNQYISYNWQQKILTISSSFSPFIIK